MVYEQGSGAGSRSKNHGRPLRCGAPDAKCGALTPEGRSLRHIARAGSSRKSWLLSALPRPPKAMTPASPAAVRLRPSPTGSPSAPSLCAVHCSETAHAERFRV